MAKSSFEDEDETDDSASQDNQTERSQGSETSLESQKSGAEQEESHNRESFVALPVLTKRAMIIEKTETMDEVVTASFELQGARACKGFFDEALVERKQAFQQLAMNRRSYTDTEKDLCQKYVFNPKRTILYCVYSQD